MLFGSYQTIHYTLHCSHCSSQVYLLSTWYSERGTSSPRYLQSNGQVERTVQTVNQMLKKSGNICMALLSYWATPLPWCNLSPAELLMGRHIQTPLPQRAYSKVVIPLRVPEAEPNLQREARVRLQQMSPSVGLAISTR